MVSVKNMRTRTRLSQRDFANTFGIPVRTLQQWEQGASSPPSYVLSMLETAVDAHLAADTTSKRHHIPKKTRWKVCIDDPFQNCDLIYPIQHRKVRELIDDISGSSTLKEMWVFGSSVTESCHIGSDVDVFVDAETEVNGNLLNRTHDFEYDVWTPATIDERLAKEIMSKGVKVYG